MRAAAGVFAVLAASCGVLGSGQFLGPRSVVQSFSSSWSSSSSWVPGRDGQMHQQVREVHTETLRDHGLAVKRTESKLACRDGLCRETVSIARPGSITVMSQGAPAAGSLGPQAMPMPANLPSRLRSVVQGILFGEPSGVKFLAPRPPPVAEAPLPFEAPLRVEEAAASRPVDKEEEASEVDEEAPPTVAAAAPGLEDFVGPYPVAPLAALAGTGTLLLGLLVAAAAKWQQRSSREVPLRSLGEPLAPAQEAVSAPRRAHGPPPAVLAPAAPKEVEAQAEGELVGAYLQGLYVRALRAAEAAAANQYMYRVYERAAA